MASLFLLYSIDYELYFSENRDEKRVLIDSTEFLLGLAERLGFRFTLFVDVPCLWKYKEIGGMDFVDAVERQLVDAVSRGHDVQVHIHPHWLTATYKNGRWTYRPEDFLVGELFRGHVYERMLDLLVRARSYLEDLLGSVRPGYSTVAFRAGGYGLQPGEREIIKALMDAGYIIDSSIVPGLVLQTVRNNINFSICPESANYYLNPDSGLVKANSDGIFEIPIPADNLGPQLIMKRIKRRVLRHNNHGSSSSPLFGTGQSDLQDHQQENGWVAKPMRFARHLWNGLTNTYLKMEPLAGAKNMCSLFERWKRKEGLPFGKFASIIVHSKGFSQREADALEEFHATITRTSIGDLSFPTFSEVASMMN